MGSYEFEANRRWRLPGVMCEVCGDTWASPVSIYPSIELTGLGWDTELAEWHHVSLPEFALIRARVAAAVPEIADLLVPGTELGPLSGRVSGPTPDVIWRLYWTPLFPASAFERSLASLNLLAVRELFDVDGHREVFYELDIRRTARRVMPDGSDPNGVRCESCRKPVLIPSANFILERSSVGDADVLRVTGAVVVSERFAEALERERLTGVRLEDVTLV